MNTDNLDELQAFITEHIPIAKAMQIQFQSYQNDNLHLSAPLTPNINHHGTAFGGSLYALAAITGWALVSLKLQEQNIAADIVIQHGEINYLAPLNTTIHLNCQALETTAWDKFYATCESHKKGRVTINATANATNTTSPAMIFNGKFVALVKN